MLAWLLNENVQMTHLQLRTTLRSDNNLDILSEPVLSMRVILVFPWDNVVFV